MGVILVPLVAALGLGISLYVAGYFLKALADAVRVIPVVGGPLGDAIEAAGNFVFGLIRGAYQAVEGVLIWFLQELRDAILAAVEGLESFTGSLGEWLAWLVTSGIPAIVRGLLHGALDLVSWLQSAFEWLRSRLDALEAYVVRSIEWLAGELVRVVETALTALYDDVLVPLWHRVEGLAGFLAGELWRLIQELAYRIGEAENWIAGEGRHVAELVARDLNPLKVTEWVVAELWRLVPAELREVLRWLWSLLVDFASLLAELIHPDRWPQLGDELIRLVVDEIESTADQAGRLLRDQLGGRPGG